MQIIAISDTHAQSLDQFPPSLIKALAAADLIIHAGDLTDMAVLQGLQQLCDVKAVAGNMCSFSLKGLLPERETFALKGKRIGLTHGAGKKTDIVPRVRRMFDDVDIIIFGHSHEPYNKVVGGVLMLNPGSARYSYGMITLEEDSVKAEIVRL